MKYWVLVLSLLWQPVWATSQLDTFLNNLKTLEAKFQQKQFSETGELLEVSQGKTYIQRPGKFRWDYQYPYKQLIVADGTKVWVHDVELEQVTIRNLDAALGKTPALLLTNKGDIHKDFTVTELSKTPKEIVFLLTPKSDGTQFENIHLTLRDKLLYKLKLIDNLEQTTEIVFSHAQSGISLDPQLFVFTPPEGVDVIVE